MLYFYPKDKTPGCTIEGHDFSKQLDQFSKLNCQVFGISKDTIALHQDFKACEGYKFELLSDLDGKVCQLFGVIQEKNMYGKKYLGIERSTFLIDENGVLVHGWRKVKVEGHVSEVLDVLRKIKAG